MSQQPQLCPSGVPSGRSLTGQPVRRFMLPKTWDINYFIIYCWSHLDSVLNKRLSTFKQSTSNKLLKMLLLLCFLATLVIVWGTFSWRRRLRLPETDEITNILRMQALKSLKFRHETASILSELFDEDGAGAWPPKANHTAWPEALRPYKMIYLELVPLLPTAKPSLDDSVNNERRNKYRCLMRKLLNERVNISKVEDIMASMEAGNWDILPRDQLNGFYACVAVCRHAYR